MNKKLAWLLGIILLTLFILGIYNTYQRLELIESVEKTTLKGEAKKNPLYAARIFLHRMGIPASSKQSLQGLKELPDTNTLLIISSKRSTLSRQATNDLYAWVQSGGHLITRTNIDDDLSDFSDDPDVTYEEYGGEQPSSDPLQELLGVKIGERLSIYDKKNEFSLHLKGAVHPLKIEGESFYPITSMQGFSKTDEIIKIKKKAFILRRQIDKGMITLVADIEFMNNREIRKADHAEILWQLAHGLRAPDNVWLIHNDEVPPLWRLMWKHAWALIITLTLMLVLWLYRASHRFGPMIPKAAEDRRSLLEHINASGNFYWKHQQKAKLIASTREALNQRLAITNPGWKQLSDAEKITQLATRLERPQQEIQQLLFDPNVGLNKSKSDEFTQLVKQLEQVRTSL
ncbi:MAG: DUF4350 domain-containing protein [Cocleimonas sp.]|nr:DUF4350 domain-containing protein [Cocleimonas sp.]